VRVTSLDISGLNFAPLPGKNVPLAYPFEPLENVIETLEN
jgi:hypothetical protein